MKSILQKSICPQPRFTTRYFSGKDGFIDEKGSKGQTDNYLGRIWYLTINLKRLNPAVNNICI